MGSTLCGGDLFSKISAQEYTLNLDVETVMGQVACILLDPPPVVN